MKMTVALLLLAVASVAVAADSMSVPVRQLTDEGGWAELGTITIRSYRDGTLFEPGLRGFHVHAMPECAPKDGKAGGAAGGHFDTENAGSHHGPYGKGHLGDLPALYADKSGKAPPRVCPRVSPDHIKGHALIIHVGTDNYSDQPKKLGGGRDRVACAKVE